MMFRVSWVYEVPQKQVWEFWPPGPLTGKWTTVRAAVLGVLAVRASAVAASEPAMVSAPNSAAASLNDFMGISLIEISVLPQSASLEGFDERRRHPRAWPVRGH